MLIKLSRRFDWSNNFVPYAILMSISPLSTHHFVICTIKVQVILCESLRLYWIDWKSAHKPIVFLCVFCVKWLVCVRTYFIFLYVKTIRIPQLSFKNDWGDDFPHARVRWAIIVCLVWVSDLVTATTMMIFRNIISQMFCFQDRNARTSCLSLYGINVWQRQINSN